MNLTELPPWSWALLVFAFWLLLYVSRSAVHRFVRRLASLLMALLRQVARALASFAAQVRSRNREIVLELGKSRLERRLDREFHRVRAFVERDLARFPDLQHEIDRHINRLEEDYHRTAETPPPAPDWLDAIESVVRLRETQSGNPVVSNVLKDLETNLHKQHRQSLADYRKGMTHRHRLLHGMMPQWRKLNHALQRVGVGIQSLLVQADEIDKHLDQYRAIQSGSERAERALRVSTVTHFLFASLALAAWFGIAWLNFELVREPLAASMVAGQTVAGFALADLATVALITLEIVFGLVLLEVLQITRFFDGFVGMDPVRRKQLLWSVLGLLTLLALSQSGLLYLREAVLSAPDPLDAFIQYPVVVVEAPMLDEWLALGARMLLGFILPFALLFTAVPLERWLETFRVLAADALIAVLNLAGLALRLVATVIRYLADMVLALYDLVISLPLWLEERWARRASASAMASKTPRPSETNESHLNALPSKGDLSVNSR